MTLPPGERAAFLASEGVPPKEAEANLRALAKTFEPNGPPAPPPAPPAA